MSTLAALLSSRARAGVFLVLFGLEEVELHVRELARRSGIHEASVRHELRKLHRLGLVSKRRDGNRVYYRGNRQHPLFEEIHGLVLKTSGLVDVLREALQEAEVELAFVFGSVARGQETAESDVDLMVLGEIGLRDLSGKLMPVTERIGREVNPHVMTREEYHRRFTRNDHFVCEVLKGPKLFVVGSEDELGAMGE